MRIRVANLSLLASLSSLIACSDGEGDDTTSVTFSATSEDGSSDEGADGSADSSGDTSTDTSTDTAATDPTAATDTTDATDTSDSDATDTDPTTGDGDDGFDPACPQASDFLDLSGANGPTGYAAPYLNVYCENGDVIVESNGIPSFDYTQITPNVLQEQNWTYRFPMEPEPAGNPADIPLGGSVAVAVNGMPIFGPTEAPMMGYHDPVYDNLLDFCSGHTAPGGVYHFHARPECLFTDFDGNTSLVVAYSYDGYPILAPYECVDGDCTMTAELVPSWQKVAGQWNGDTPLYNNTSEGAWDVWEFVSGSGDLDECNGRELEGGGYAYYATEQFPYFMGCYRGVKSGNMQG